MSLSYQISDLESQLEKCCMCDVVFSEKLANSVPRELPCGDTLCHGCFIDLAIFDGNHVYCCQCTVHTSAYSIPINREFLEHNARIQEQIEELVELAENPCVEDASHLATLFCESCSADFCSNCFEHVHQHKVFWDHDVISLHEKDQKLAEMLQEELAPPAENPCIEVASHQATIFCESCSADFCEQCFDTTHKPKAFSSHKKVSLPEKPIQLSKCTKHTYNTSEFLCKEPNCDKETKLMCHTCLLVDHKDHSYEMLMEKLVENEKKAVEMIEKVAENTKSIRSSLDSKNLLLNSYSTESKAFERKSKEISDYFDSLKSTAIQDLEKYVGKEAKQMNKEKSEMETYLKKSVEMEKELGVVVKSKRNLESLDAILPNAQNIVDKTFKTRTRLPLDEMKISWRNDTKLELREEDGDDEKHRIP